MASRIARTRCAGDVDLQRSTEAQRCCWRFDDMSKQAARVGVRWIRNVRFMTANIVVHHCSCYLVLNERLRAADPVLRIIGLRNLCTEPHRELSPNVLTLSTDGHSRSMLPRPELIAFPHALCAKES